MTIRAIAPASLAAAAIVLLVLALALALVGAAPAGAKKVKGSCANAQIEPEALSYDQATDVIRCLVNKKRAGHGIGALAANADLGDAAQRHTTTWSITAASTTSAPARTTWWGGSRAPATSTA